MIREMNHTCKKINDALGISIKLPKPKKRTLKITSALNFVVGVSLLAVGVLLSNKWCAAFGGVSIISGIVQKHEEKIK